MVAGDVDFVFVFRCEME